MLNDHLTGLVAADIQRDAIERADRARLARIARAGASRRRRPAVPALRLAGVWARIVGMHARLVVGPIH